MCREVSWCSSEIVGGKDKLSLPQRKVFSGVKMPPGSDRTTSADAKQLGSQSLLPLGQLLGGLKGSRFLLLQKLKGP